MIVQERLSWVKRLNLIQFLINFVIFAVIIIFGMLMMLGGMSFHGFYGMMPHYSFPFAMIGPLAMLIIFFVGLFHAFLPLVANWALDQRKSGWTWVAIGIMAYITITGGGVFTVLSLIALILMIDGPTYTYLTGERPPFSHPPQNTVPPTASA